MVRNLTPEPQRSQLLAALAAVDAATEGLRTVDEGLRSAVRAAHAAGGSVRDIAELTSKSTNTIQRWLKEQ